MKRINLFAILLLSFMFISNTTHAKNKVYDAFATNRIDVATKIQVGGFWSEDWNFDNKMATQISKDSFVITIYPKAEQAWNYYCKIYVKDFEVPNKKIIKKHQNEKQDFFFVCDVEFFYNVQYPSLEECFADYGGFVVNSKDSDAKKRTIEGVIAFSRYFFTAGDKFDKGDISDMIMSITIDDTALGIYLLDHLKF